MAGTRLVLIGLAALAGSAWARAQAPRALDIASIHPSRISRAGGEGSGQETMDVQPERITFTNASLSYCMQWAWDVRFYQISGLDASGERYDITAKRDAPASVEQLRAMTRALLADRFQLRLHREMRRISVYELVAPARKSELRLDRAAADETPGLGVVNGSFVFLHVTMGDFAERLSDFSGFDRPVVDRTGIDGVFDITLDGAASAMRADPDSIFGAVERLGLRLNRSKAEMPILVVDHAAKPSAN